MDKQTYLYLNYVCNSNCIFCASDLTNRTKNIQSISLDKIKELLDKQSILFNRLLISGGEPTVHKEIIEILRYATTKFRQVNLATNGILLSDYAFAKDIVDTGISRVAIPFYHTDPCTFNELVRNDKAYDSIISAIKNLSQLKKSGHNFDVNIKLLIMKPNYKVNPDVVEFIRQIFSQLKYITLATLRISEKVLKNRERLVVNLNEARPYISETVRIMLKYGISFTFDYVPLCALEQDLLYELLKIGTLFRRQTISTIIRPETVLPNKPLPYYESSSCRYCAVNAYCSRVPKKNHQHMNYDAQLHHVFPINI